MVDKCLRCGSDVVSSKSIGSGKRVVCHDCGFVFEVR